MVMPGAVLFQHEAVGRYFYDRHLGHDRFHNTEGQ